MSEALDFFNSRVKEDKMGGIVDAVLSIDNPRDARLFFDGYVELIRNANKRFKKPSPQQIAKGNIGWCFAEGMSEKHMRMWIKACGAEHPAFGRKIPTDPNKAFQMGVRMGRRMAKKSWKRGRR